MAADAQSKMKIEQNNVKRPSKSSGNRVKIAAPYAYVEVGAWGK